MKPCLPQLSSLGVRAPTARPRGVLILPHPWPMTWLACFRQIAPQAARPDLSPADWRLLSSKSFPFPPVHPVLSPFPRSTSHNPVCKLGAPSLPHLFSVPFSQLCGGLEGCSASGAAGKKVAAPQVRNEVEKCDLILWARSLLFCCVVAPVD